MGNRSLLIIFLAVVLIVHTLVNLYIYRHTRLAFSLLPWGDWLKWAFWILVLTYPAARVLEHIYPSTLTTFTLRVGSMWLGAMLYLTLLFLLVDLLRFTSWATGLPMIHHNPTVHLRAIGAVYLATVATLTAGHLNALHPRVHRIDISAVTWHDEHLWLLSDEEQKIMRVDPTTYRVVGEWGIPSVVKPEGMAFLNPSTLLVLCDQEHRLYYLPAP